jgi:2,3-bisphosphoglycerate-independent phosphoglycerate mutase
VLAGEPAANGLLLRGFDTHRELPRFRDRTGLRAAAVAVYPMYRGLARLVNMDVLDAGQTLDDQAARLEAAWNDYDFFFLHYKYTDSSGEDGNFDAKVARTEEFDAAIPRIAALKPDVLVVTGDHSTPSKLRSHSWHPVPVLLTADMCRFDGSESFGESQCLRGGLGQFEAKYLMLHALAHAGRLEKYGA